MNNQQFRRLITDNNDERAPAQRSAQPAAALGSRARPSVAMTPRSISGISSNEFKRQLAERNAGSSADSSRKFRSSAAPKGTKLAAGYQDRTKSRISDDDDEKARRVLALEDMVKLGQMDEATFHKVRDELIGGDVKDVHLVKGLDYRLLRRVKAGEDVLTENVATGSSPPAASPTEYTETSNVDNEFEKLEVKEVTQRAREEKVKSGTMAPPPVVGRKRTRDDILKELKAARAGASSEAIANKAALGSKFSKIGKSKQQSRLERDEKGQEVLILVDADGNVKRKIRKGAITTFKGDDTGLLLPDKEVAPLGMDVPTISPHLAPQEEKDLDIFEGVGVDFDPLGQDSSDVGSEDNEVEGKDGQLRDTHTARAEPVSTGEPPQIINASRPFRNYFNEPQDSAEKPLQTENDLQDPEIIAALKRASKIQEESSAGAEDRVTKDRLSRHRRMLESHDRDAEDLDLGFGSSRRGDEEDAEDSRGVKLSKWGEDGGEEEKDRSGKAARKRGPKRKKVDGESAAAVFEVLERRKVKDK